MAGWKTKEDKAKRLLQPTSFKEAIEMIDHVSGKKDPDSLIDVSSIGPITHGVYRSTVLDKIECDYCMCLDATYWICQECGDIICYHCLIQAHKIVLGEITFKCQQCQSSRLFLKHNILTVPFGFRL
jgi:hypothetical protein